MNPFLFSLTMLFFMCSIIMFFTWIVARSVDNYSVVDAVWGFLFFMNAVFLTIYAPGWSDRKLLMLAVVSAWSLRLFSFLAKRIYRHHPLEDHRYQDMRKEFEPHVQRRFLLFFQYQAWSVVLLTAPFLAMSFETNPQFSFIEGVGFGITIFSILGESVADAQKAKFKRNMTQKDENCEIGLWKYSRHPNYFFESMIWFGFFIMSLGSHGGVYALYCPLLILFLLLKVTGIPLAEKKSIEVFGDAYRRYQKKTSILIPWFQKTLVLILFIPVAFNALADGVTPDRTAKIYEIKKTNQSPLFILKTHYSLSATGETIAETQIVDSNGKKAVTEKAIYQGINLIFQDVEQFQTEEHYTAKVKGKEIVFSKKNKNSTSDLRDSFITGPTSELFLAQHWQELLDGNTIYAPFGVLEILDTVGFKFWMKRKENVNGKETVVVAMKPSSFFLSIIVKEIEMFLDPETKRFVRYVGRTPLMKRDSSGSLKPLDAEIEYGYAESKKP